MSNGGWIKLHRQIKDHWLFKERRQKTKFEAWVNILLDCNHSPAKVLISGSLIDCDKGQSIKSIGSWAKEFNWSSSKVKNFFILLQKEGMITVEGLSKTTRITVCKYDSYQVKEITKGEHKDNRKITDGDKQEEIRIINNKKNNINNSEFVQNCLDDMQWLEITAMQNKVKIEVIKIFITTFENQLITRGEQKQNVRKFKDHFVNWLGKQNLSQFRVKKIGKTNQI